MDRYSHSARLGVLIALASFLAVTSLVPTSAAQYPPLPLCEDIAPSMLQITGAATGPITPIKGTEIASLEYSYQAPEQAWSHNPIPITFSTTDVPGWATAILDSTVVFVDVEPGTMTEVMGTLKISMAVDNNAPAFQRDLFHVTAEAEAGTCVGASEHQADVEVTPGFFERWDAQAEPQTYEAMVGDTIPLTVTVENDGNGPIEIGFRPTDEPENGEFVLPEGLYQVATADQGESTRNIDLQHTALEPGHERVSIQVFGRSSDDVNRELTPETVTVAITTLHSEGDMEELPLTVIPLIMALLAIGLAVSRSRR